MIKLDTTRWSNDLNFFVLNTVVRGLPYFTQAFLNFQSWGGGHEDPHHNFVVVAPMIMKFGIGIKLDVFYTTVTKNL